MQAFFHAPESTFRLRLESDQQTTFVRKVVDRISEIVAPFFNCIACIWQQFISCFPCFASERERVAPMTQVQAEMIAAIKCYSSIWMEHLSNWRNPEDPSLTPYKDFGRYVVTELALPVLTLTASIETVVYTALDLGAKALSPLTNGPRNFVAKHQIAPLADSAKFTVWWTILSLVKNVTIKQLPAEEFHARRVYSSS